MEVVPSSPTGRSNHTLTWKIPLPVLFTSPRFHTHLPCPPLINAAKHSHPEPVQRTSLSSVLPHLFLSIILIKSIWKFLWGFLSVYILGSARAPMLVTPGEAMLRNSDWQARQPIAKSRMQEWVSGLRLAPREEEGRRQRRRRIKAAFQTQRVPRQQES